MAKEQEVNLLRVFMVGTQMHLAINPPTNEDGVKLLQEGVARALVNVCLNLQEKDLVCHAGCVFASVLELAHKRFHEALPEEYERIVKEEMLTPSDVTKPAH